MRKAYLDNIRWFTVVLVVIYHVFYMYNAEGIQGVVGKITDLDVQYWDVYQYFVFPWFMLILFIVSGICSKLYLDGHTAKEFVKSRTTKLLVPSTVGLFAFQFIQGYINTRTGDAVAAMEAVPFFVKFLIMVASGISVLWYIQLLWLFSMVLLPVRRIENGRLLELGKRAGLIVLIVLLLPMYGAAQILNTPIICVYRFGYYFLAFLLGYYVFSHEEVIDTLKRWFALFCPVALILGVVFCVMYFGQNYADKPVNRTIVFVAFGWFACLAILGGSARFFDRETSFTRWMNSWNFGLYVFHYLGISSVAVFLAKPGLIPAWAAYLLSLIAGFVLAYILNAVISRLPFFRWAVLGISKKPKVNAGEKKPD